MAWGARRPLLRHRTTTPPLVRQLYYSLSLSLHPAINYAFYLVVLLVPTLAPHHPSPPLTTTTAIAILEQEQ